MVQAKDEQLSQIDFESVWNRLFVSGFPERFTQEDMKIAQDVFKLAADSDHQLSHAVRIVCKNPAIIVASVFIEALWVNYDPRNIICPRSKNPALERELFENFEYLGFSPGKLSIVWVNRALVKLINWGILMTSFKQGCEEIFHIILQCTEILLLAVGELWSIENLILIRLRWSKKFILKSTYGKKEEGDEMIKHAKSR